MPDSAAILFDFTDPGYDSEPGEAAAPAPRLTLHLTTQLNGASQRSTATGQGAGGLRDAFTVRFATPEEWDANPDWDGLEPEPPVTEPPADPCDGVTLQSWAVWRRTGSPGMDDAWVTFPLPYYIRYATDASGNQLLYETRIKTADLVSSDYGPVGWGARDDMVRSSFDDESDVYHRLRLCVAKANLPYYMLPRPNFIGDPVSLSELNITTYVQDSSLSQFVRFELKDSNNSAPSQLFTYEEFISESTDDRQYREHVESFSPLPPGVWYADCAVFRPYGGYDARTIIDQCGLDSGWNEFSRESLFALSAQTPVLTIDASPCTRAPTEWRGEGGLNAIDTQEGTFDFDGFGFEDGLQFDYPRTYRAIVRDGASGLTTIDDVSSARRIGIINIYDEDAEFSWQYLYNEWTLKASQFGGTWRTGESVTFVISFSEHITGPPNLRYGAVALLDPPRFRLVEQDALTYTAQWVVSTSLPPAMAEAEGPWQTTPPGGTQPVILTKMPDWYFPYTMYEQWFALNEINMAFTTLLSTRQSTGVLISPPVANITLLRTTFTYKARFSNIWTYYEYWYTEDHTVTLEYYITSANCSVMPPPVFVRITDDVEIFAQRDYPPNPPLVYYTNTWRFVYASDASDISVGCFVTDYIVDDFSARLDDPRLFFSTLSPASAACAKIATRERVALPTMTLSTTAPPAGTAWIRPDTTATKNIGGIDYAAITQCALADASGNVLTESYSAPADMQSDILTIHANFMAAITEAINNAWDCYLPDGDGPQSDEFRRELVAPVTETSTEWVSVPSLFFAVDSKDELRPSPGAIPATAWAPFEPDATSQPAWHKLASPRLYVAGVEVP